MVHLFTPDYKNTNNGTTTIRVTASDGKGGSVEDAFDITISAKTLSLSNVNITGTNVDTSQSVSLQHGDRLTVTSSDGGVATVVEGTEGQIEATGVANGTATITATVKNVEGDTIAIGIFTVTVTGN